MSSTTSVHLSFVLGLSLCLVLFGLFGCLASAATTGIPEFRSWESDMIQYGKLNCDNLQKYAVSGSLDDKFGATYYDAIRVFYQIADYTGDPSWQQCAQLARTHYRDLYVFPNNGAVPGYWNFTRGLRMDYERTHDDRSKQAVILLSENAAFARDSTPLAWTQNCALSREVAYAIMSYLNAEALGAPPRARKADLITQALGHIDQWFVAKTCAFTRPFMVGLTMQALIQAYESAKDDRIPPAIDTALNGIWACCWLSSKETFMYTNIVAPDGTGGQEPMPDLNLLIVPAYGWRYLQTGNTAYRDRGDQVFGGGVLGAWLYNNKQFDQNYMSSFDYVTWRKAADAKYASPASPRTPAPQADPSTPSGKQKTPGQLKVR